MIKAPSIIDYEYTVADVYDDAAVIGQELEKIITNYGADILKDLMPKVVRVLELLENFIIKNERENDEITELKTRINILEVEKITRLNDKDKFERELEEIEIKWKEETMRLIDMVNKLKEDNRNLQEKLTNTKANEQSRRVLAMEQDEQEYIKKIKEDNMQLKSSLKFKENELEQKNSDLESLQTQIDNLSSTISNFRRKQILSQNQTQKLIKEKAELECCLKEQEHKINIIKSQMRRQSEHDEVETKQGDDETEYVDAEMNFRKMALEIAEKDPNRPRYTLNELHEVLMEKNELKVKLHETQEELQLFRKSEEQKEEDIVQGPINKEPEEKLNEYKVKTQGGIRRFFRRFLFTYKPDYTDDESQQSIS